MNDEILGGLVVTVESLRQDSNWLRILAENLFWASCEGFVQSSILAAYNAQNLPLVADREKVLKWDGGSITPDLLVFRRADYADWRRSANGTGRNSLAHALAQITMVWTRGTAGGSAVVTEKAKKIARDAAGLIRFCDAHSGTLAYLGVLTSGFQPAGHGASAVEDAVCVVRAALARNGISIAQESHTTILDGVLLETWETLGRPSPSTCVFAGLHWFRLDTGPPVESTNSIAEADVAQRDVRVRDLDA